MATKQIKKLSDLQKITTATGDQMIPVVDASGNVNPIKLTDLAQVVAGLIQFNFPSLSIISDVNNCEPGIVHIKKETLNNPAGDFATCITFHSNAYNPQIVIKWDGTTYIRHDNKENSTWYKMISQKV